MRLTVPSVRTILAIGIAVMVAVGGLAVYRRAGALFGTPAPPRVSHDLVVQQIRSVAKLVTSEATVRDVVVYEQTRFTATKRALLVVTGRVLAGIDLDSTAADGGAEVRIDHEARRITVSLPPAELLAVEVVNVRTYDERAGLINPFRPADRDDIQRQVRAQLERAGRDMGLLELANRSAVALLQSLLARDGYTVDVSIRGRPIRMPGG
jgi:hypothetical protein